MVQAHSGSWGLPARLDATITGSVITQDGGHYYNRLLWAAPCGELRTYDKRHLFRMGLSTSTSRPGAPAWSVSWRGFQHLPAGCATT